MNAAPLTIERCGRCGACWSLPREFCPRCGSGAVEEMAVCGRATLFAATHVSRTPEPAFAEIAPFWIALVDLEEGPRLLAHLESEAPIGARLVGGMARIAGRSVASFAPAGNEAGA